MILKSVRPINWGPFFDNQTLEIESDTTVLTSANDAGKSSLLRLIDAAYRPTREAIVREEDLNIDHRDASTSTSWKNNPAFGCELRFTATGSERKYLNFSNEKNQTKLGDEIVMTCNLAPEAANRTIKVQSNDGSRPSFPVALAKMPHIIGLPTQHLVGDLISLSDHNHAERLLLQVAFGPEFKVAILQDYKRQLYVRAVREASVRLNEAIKRVIPAPLRLQVELRETGNQTELSLEPCDQEFGYAPLTERGDGIKILLSLMASLLEANDIDSQILIYIDEPETHLHADAQHLLRGLLEDLASKANIQIIWATHSPAMINNMRPRAVRLLRRIAGDEHVTTEIVNRPIDNNCVLIRTTLGISASDSLQLAPVTIVVEGQSEALGISMILDQLHKLGVEGFADVPLIVPLCHIADGEGDSYFRMAKFAVSQNSQVVVFLDGDKQVEKKVKEALPTVAFVQIDNKEEIEQLLDPNIYFQALAGELGAAQIAAMTQITPAKFQEWLDQQEDKVKFMAFSKQLTLWLVAIAPAFTFRKPQTFRRALDLLEREDQIRVTELRKLVEAIIERLPSPDK